MLASSYWFQPATSTPQGTIRTYRATFFYALGAIVGWPFSAALGIPFVFEQLFLGGGEIVPTELTHIWRSKRWDTMWKAVTMSASIVLPVYLIDSWVYGRLTFPTLNIITYNLFSGNGPELYGTSLPHSTSPTCFSILIFRAPRFALVARFGCDVQVRFPPIG